MADDDPTVQDLFGTLRPTRFRSDSDPNSVIQSSETGDGNIQPLGGFLADGIVTGSSLDTTPPAVPTGLTLGSDVVLNSDGTAFVRLLIGLVQPSDTDLFGSYVEVTHHNDGAEPPNPVWDRPDQMFIPESQTQTRLDDAKGATPYWARARAVDVLGNYSTYTSVVAHTTVGDTTVPPTPEPAILTAGFKGFGAFWSGGDAEDRSYYDMRWVASAGIVLALSAAADDIIDTVAPHGLAVDNPVAFKSLTGGAGLATGTTYYVIAANLGASTFQVSAALGGSAVNFTTDITAGEAGTPPDTDEGAWTFGQSLTSVVFISGLTENLLHWFEIRSVDRSGNRSGWSVASSIIPHLIGSTDIAANSITAAMIQAGALDADKISTGTLTIKPSGAAHGIHVLTTTDQLIVDIHSDGTVKFVDPNNPSNYLFIDAGVLKFTTDAGVTFPTAISPAGVNATAITFGESAGGHNLVSNSSFELAGFVAQPSSAVFTDNSGTPGWKAANRTTAPVNTTEGAADLQVTALAY